MLNSKKIATSVSIATALLIGFSMSGCAGNQPRVDYEVYKPTQKVEIQSSDIIKVSKGRLTFKGNTIMDEDGDIALACNIDGKLFYFVTKEMSSSAVYTLKDGQGKEVKKFEGHHIRIMRDEDNLPIIMVQLADKKLLMSYDNVYKFDGKDVKLVNKNFPMRYNEMYGAGYQIIPIIYQDGGFGDSYFPLESVTTNETRTIHVLHPQTFFGRLMKDSFHIVGTAGPNILYTHYDQNDEMALEAYNLKTGEQKVLAKGNNQVQILQSGDKKILRILSNPALHSESSKFQNTVVSRYDNEVSTFIDLATLNEVKINMNDFNKMILQTGFTNLAGGYTREWYITYPLSKLHRIVEDRKGKMLF